MEGNITVLTIIVKTPMKNIENDNKKSEYLIPLRVVFFGQEIKK